MRRKREAEQRGVVTFLRVMTLFPLTRCGMQKNRLITFFLLPAFKFSYRGTGVAQKTRSGTKGSCHFFKSDDSISSHTVRDAENRLVTSALLREKMGTLLPAKRYLYRVTTLFLPHTARDAGKTDLSPFFTTCVSNFAQRGVGEMNVRKR